MGLSTFVPTSTNYDNLGQPPPLSGFSDFELMLAPKSLGFPEIPTKRGGDSATTTVRQE